MKDCRHSFQLSVVCLTVALTVASQAAEKARNWHTGKVIDSQSNRYIAGTVGNANTTPGMGEPGGPFATFPKTTNSSQRAVYRVNVTFTIEAEQYVYEAQERVRKSSRAANLTVNGPVKYAIEKRKLFVIDEDGKEHEMELVKKILREPAGPGTPQQ